MASSHKPLPFVVIVLVYGALALSLSTLLLSNLVFDDLLAGVREGVATVVAATLNLVGIPLTARGAVIHGPGSALLIVNECTGVDATILVVSAVLVFPAPWRRRLLGATLAIGVMMATNFVRLLTLVYLGNFHGEWLDVAHLYVWPVIVILLGVGTLLLWADRYALARPS